ncbi:signal peptidase I [Neomegalonema sp.]|uniref:signal peptidase I n=1 Tax=Neomegalonema sp. TaxID=2039713 RepID=UPI00260590DA|nr:signal peptidase I [Neomegalonema sp.]MDD2867561.1 signal peptidase I [Neomegalonema sp.]
MPASPDPNDQNPSEGRPSESSPISSLAATPREQGRRETLGEFVRTIVYALLIALAFRVVLFQPFSIPSGSMKSTLLVGDYLFVSKYAYGYSRYSLPFSPDLFSGRILAREPERGDVIVFKLPTDNATDYVKRLVGLPGDRIQVQRSRLYINGELLPQRRIADFSDLLPDGRKINHARFIETMPNGREYEVLNYSDHSPTDNTPEFVVPAGHYFMMGDNRDDSMDSRTTHVGYVPAENLIGRAEIIFLSAQDEPDGRGGLTSNPLAFWTWRLQRFFTVVD